MAWIQAPIGINVRGAMTFSGRNKLAFLAAITVACVAIVLWSRKGSSPEEPSEITSPAEEPTQSETAISPATSPVVISNPVPKTVLVDESRANEEADYVRRIAAQKEAVRALEAETYAKDPHLQVYEKFREDPQQWFQTNFLRFSKALWAYEHPEDPLEAKKREKVCQDLRALFGMSNTKDLAEDPQYTHLLTTSSEFIARLHALKKGELTPLFWTTDRLIGWKEPVAATEENLTGEQVLAGYARRYELVNQKISELVQEHQVPEDVVSYIKAKSISQCLTGGADVYTQTRTPLELRDMRTKLRFLERDLNNLRARRGTN